ncbi:MAG: hypothetical protein KAQ97_04050 [Candidatus Fermentibacteraceae bacterium]|nr:hypothetical protein [Candidatus Fermentibacteraceae bacterium]
MAKLSELIHKIDSEVKSGNRKKALLMLDRLMEKVPDNRSLISRKAKYGKEYEYEKRITALQEKYGTL